MPPTQRLARRGLLAIGGATLTAPALAQSALDTLFRSGGSVLRSFSMTEPDELALGRGHYRPLLAESGGAYPSQRVQSAIQRFAAPLFATSGRKTFDWEITVLDDNSVNAWALPGGKLAVNKGLLRYAASESELAAVISHEIGHAELSHHLQAIRRDNFTQALTAAGRDIAVSSLRGPGGALTAVGIDALRTLPSGPPGRGSDQARPRARARRRVRSGERYLGRRSRSRRPRHAGPARAGSSHA